MKLDANPLFRKVIAPWYDSDTTCWVLLVCLAGVAGFSVVGISVARSDVLFHRHVWVPITLLVLSLLAAASIIYRLIKRRYDQHVQNRTF